MKRKDDPLSEKRRRLAYSMNAALGSRYSADHPDIMRLPESVLDDLLAYYGGNHPQHVY